LDYGDYFPATLLTLPSDIFASFHEKISEGIVLLESYFQEKIKNQKNSSPFIGVFHGSLISEKIVPAYYIAQKYSVELYQASLSDLLEKDWITYCFTIGFLFNRLKDRKCILVLEEAESLFLKDVLIEENSVLEDKLAELIYLINTFTSCVILTTANNYPIENSCTEQLNINTILHYI
jgi:hypothetical protein